jgi:hypothetical protein
MHALTTMFSITRLFVLHNERKKYLGIFLRLKIKLILMSPVAGAEKFGKLEHQYNKYDEGLFLIEK